MRIIFLTLLAAVMGVAQMNAQTIIDTWQIGTPIANDVTAVLTGNVLTISGTGAMPNFNMWNVPWQNYREVIKSVIIEDGITTIGDWAFVLLADGGGWVNTDYLAKSPPEAASSQ